MAVGVFVSLGLHAALFLPPVQRAFAAITFRKESATASLAGTEPSPEPALLVFAPPPEPDPAPPPELEPQPEPEPPPSPEPPPVTLGIGDGDPTARSWLGFSDFLEHFARPAETDQPALRLAPPATGDGGGGGPDAPQPSPAESIAPVQPPAEPEIAPVQPPAEPENAPVPTPVEPENAPVQPPAEPENAPVQPPAQPPAEPENAPVEPREEPGPLPVPVQRPSPEEAEGSIPTPESPSSPAPTATPDPALDEPPIPFVGPPAPPPTTPALPLVQPAAAPGTPGTPGDDLLGDGELSDSESDPTSIVDVPPNLWRNGRPIAAKGMSIKTRRPRFTTLTMVTVRPNNPIVEIEFAKDGRPKRYEFVREPSGRIRNSGARDIDGPILDAIAGWRASGGPLDNLREGDTVTIRMRLVLVE
jgi:hypothetical protein